jgi:hypothetical protein
MPPLSFGSALTGLITLALLLLALRKVLGWLLYMPTVLRLARENNAMLRSLHAHHGVPLPEGLASVKRPALDAARAAVRARFARQVEQA